MISHIDVVLIFFWFFGYFIAIFHLEKLFLPYLEMHTGPWKQHPPEHHPQPSPYFFLIFYIFYSFFSFSIARPSIYGNAHWTLKQYQPIITTNSSKHHPPIFFHILLLFFIQHSHTFHIWKCALDPENSTQTSSPTVATIPLFFLIFSIFYSFFSFSIATPSIYGNAHWTLKQYQPIITTNSSKHHPPFFFWFFPYFIAFFHSA